MASKIPGSRVKLVTKCGREGGVTVLQDFWFMIYYIVVGVFLILSIVAGRRAGCHYICWMALFMIIGRRIRNVFKWPALRIKVDADKCVDCLRCTRECSTSLDVHAMVRQGSIENDECTLCGTCIDVCPQHVKHYSFSTGK